ncbi:MAG TPA: TadE family protein [Nonomuraea sp.]|nr:TadE family protein [Nonomuraea sp.]
MEFALLFPVFIVLAMGTIAAGTAYSKQINLTQAAREASRFGATFDMSDPAVGIDSWLTAVDTALQESAGDADNPLGGYDYRCVAYVTTDSAGLPDPLMSRYSENGGATTAGSCPGGTVSARIPQTDYVQVAVARSTSFFMIFVNPTLQLDGLSFTPYEAKAPETLPAIP